jgi:hypothetical protein
MHIASQFIVKPPSSVFSSFPWHMDSDWCHERSDVVHSPYISVRTTPSPSSPLLPLFRDLWDQNTGVSAGLGRVNNWTLKNTFNEVFNLMLLTQKW